MIDVTIDRDKYIGGSDIPAIMGISPFKKRFQLLLEKAGLATDDFGGNQYTDYGNLLEPKIREYMEGYCFTSFPPSQTIKGDLRTNMDGFDGETVLEIKTTSHIYETADEYKIYLVQLLFYMAVNEVTNGYLAVYKRPADFNPDFDAENLQIFEILAKDYKTLTAEIFAEIDRFRADLQRLKENPLLTEEDFQPTELVTLSREVVALEVKMAEFKNLEKQYKDMKQKLYEAMTAAAVDSWAMPNGTKITRIEGKPASVKLVEEFDLTAFKEEHADLYKGYVKEVPKETAGRAGYVRITLPKE